jgi:DNA polymerase-1
VKKQQMMWFDEVREKWGCGPDDIRYVKAISGDSSDNIIGVKGVGPKTAIKILEESGWLLDVACQHKKLKDHKELILSNLNLVVLRNVAGTLGPILWSDHLLGQGMEKDYRDFLEKYELSSLLKRASSTSKLLKLR